MLTDNQKRIMGMIDDTRLGEITYWEKVALVQSIRKILWDQNFGKIIRELLLDLEEIEKKNRGLSYCAKTLYIELINAYGSSDKEYFIRDITDDERKKSYKKNYWIQYTIGIIITLIFLILVCLYVIFPMLVFK